MRYQGYSTGYAPGVSLLPSAEQLLSAFLRGQPLISAIVGSRVGKSLGGVFPAVRLSRIGGGPTQRWEDSPELQVDCWADDPETADLLARTVVAVVPLLDGAQSAGFVRGVDVTLGPLWAPDQETNRPRYLLDCLLRTYAL